MDEVAEALAVGSELSVALVMDELAEALVVGSEFSVALVRDGF